MAGACLLKRSRSWSLEHPGLTPLSVLLSGGLWTLLSRAVAPRDMIEGGARAV